MQKLKFESSWDKTISNQDREQIEQVFYNTQNVSMKPVQLTPLWQATNYKKQLLVTLLVQNTSKQTVTFQNTKMNYLENGVIMAVQSFTLPSLIIEPQTSMPWTFIFPTESFDGNVALENGILEIVE